MDEGVWDALKLKFQELSQMLQKFIMYYAVIFIWKDLTIA